MDAMPAINKFMSQEFGNLWAPMVSGEISSHAIDRAPIASSRTPFSIVTFSHGLGSTGFQYTVLIEFLVSHGYVVASIEHPYTAKAIWFTDGRVITQRNDSPPARLSQAERLSWIMKQTSVGINQGAADIRFVIDRMKQLNHDKQSSFFHMVHQLRKRPARIASHIGSNILQEPGVAKLSSGDCTFPSLLVRLRKRTEDDLRQRIHICEQSLLRCTDASNLFQVPFQ